MMEFCRQMLNFQCHNDRFQKHFYVHFLSRGHYKSVCHICAKKEKEIKEDNLKFLRSIMEHDSDSDPSEDCQSQITSRLTISNKDHRCIVSGYRLQ